jgi:uncharacterized protein (DUF427 family)
MKAALGSRVIAQSDDVVECDGYAYFPRAAVRMEWLERSAKTSEDLRCPHGVQFYDVVIDGVRHARAAWSYEAPRAALAHVGQRMGFWEDVEVS